MRAGLQAILVAPQTLFRLESVPENVQAGESFRLNDIDLANRLSFFLWASGPDEELLRVAAAGDLSDEDELERQVQRMLADPKAEALATRFAAFPWSSATCTMYAKPPLLGLAETYNRSGVASTTS